MCTEVVATFLHILFEGTGRAMTAVPSFLLTNNDTKKISRVYFSKVGRFSENLEPYKPV